MAIAAFVVLLALAGLIAAAPASASSAASAKAKGCAGQVVSDWYSHIHSDGRVHGHYPLHCYQDALNSLDSSVEEYTNAKQAISAALAAEALRCKTNCGPTDGNGPESSVLQPGEKPIARHNTYDFGGRPVIEPPQVTPPVNTSSPSSVPLPLIILAALAGILLLAGAGSYIARRLKANRPAPPATDTSS